TRLDDARAAIRQAEALRPNLLTIRRAAFLVAFVTGNRSAAAGELAAVRQQSETAAASDWEARAVAFDGRVGNAHDLFRRAVDEAMRSDSTEAAGQWSAAAAEMHAAGGPCAAPRADALDALRRSRDNFTLERPGR